MKGERSGLASLSKANEVTSPSPLPKEVLGALHSPAWLEASSSAPAQISLGHLCLVPEFVAR